jgi:hypothetical protein
MSELVYERLKEGLAEIRAFTVGAKPAARIHINGLPYVPEQDWMPISTAPRDGSRFWACDLSINRDGSVYEQVTWLSQAGDWWMIDEQTGGPIVANPSVWRPLPKPPASTHNPEKEE